MRIALRLARWTSAALLATLLSIPPSIAVAEDFPADSTISTSKHDAGGSHVSPDRGYRLLTSKPYLPPDFDDEILDALWKQWEEPLRSEAEHATPAERRRMAYARYGLMPPPEDEERLVALQYVDDGAGGWVMNCFACHGGKVAGRVIPGLPNSHYDLQTLTEEVRATKLTLGKPFAHMDRGSLLVPLGGSRGTTNATAFGVLLMAFRDAELNVVQGRAPPPLLHHDQDAPPWWNVKKKERLYIDGSTPKSHRAIMQFLLIPENGPGNFREWEDDFRSILAYIESIEPPKFPWEVDADLAERGETIFRRNCARCHGTYGEEETYPEKWVPIDLIGTDRARFDALSTEARARLAHSWLGGYGEPSAPTGYVAPPLDGIWASAPYFHNGSVPTLWHVLHSADRPVVWRRASEDGYDREQVGIEITTFDEVPESVSTSYERRQYFNTRLPGKSATGHTFPDSLEDDERRAVLEYLKTL